jgi:hypothetical protein
MPLWNFIVGASLKAHATSRIMSCFLDVGGAGEKRLYNYDKLNSCAARSDPLLKCGFLRAESLILHSVALYVVCTRAALICRFNWRKESRTDGGSSKCKVLRRAVHLFYFYWARWRNWYVVFRAASKKQDFSPFFMGFAHLNESKLSR